ncbi:hypothetical protein A2154_01625 [Candidatus Gottesmanbacteria bacterium RBG_16_43_7]|uniref:Glycosyltransferase RgtA/B/C/D-like domain-containing protein n=1 Tax=Candidatus Gottesmanbacteria bacterium RBG_16_43_7 TaxID=1798373 RepID=A0A1F5ZBB0_9BACT|nr:MAG: hypothetical protein A2154_01625 [Candidatus Gottesmanbacteria bacterium RBG_16_43_7]
MKKLFKSFRLTIKQILNIYPISFYVILGIITIRLLDNLNYNGPFNDEAIYVVVGKLGLFQHDWRSFNADAWVSGWQHLYPALTALAYEIYGIAGSRLLSVIAGILLCETLVLIAVSLSGFQKLPAQIVAGITLLTVGFSATFYFISRLATMDIFSFFFTFLGILLILKTTNTPWRNGKILFLAAVCTAISVLFKYASVILIPAVFLFGLTQTKSHNTSWRRMFLIYFVSPLIFLLALFTLIHFQSLTTYFQYEVEGVHSEVSKVLSEIWTSMRYLIPLWVIGIIGLIKEKKWRTLVTLTFLAITIPAYHILTVREQTLNKHIIVTIAAAGITSAIGISNLIMPNRFKLHYISGIISFLLLGAYIFLSIPDGKNFNVSWTDTRPAMRFFADHSQNGDRILTESGAAIILASYTNNHPEHITTFDWFLYRRLEGDEAYTAAVKDGYFSYVQLEDPSEIKEEHVANLSDKIRSTIGNSYTVAMQKDGLIVYQRKSEL